jgi:hypothetical protein
VFHPRGELATKEDGTARIDRSQFSGSFGEINRLDEPSVQVAGFVNVGIEIGQALDVDQTSGHDAVDRLLTTQILSGAAIADA